MDKKPSHEIELINRPVSKGDFNPELIRECGTFILEVRAEVEKILGPGQTLKRIGSITDIGLNPDKFENHEVTVLDIFFAMGMLMISAFGPAALDEPDRKDKLSIATEKIYRHIQLAINMNILDRRLSKSELYRPMSIRDQSLQAESSSDDSALYLVQNSSGVTILVLWYSSRSRTTLSFVIR